MANQPIVGALSLVLKTAVDVPVFVADVDSSITGALVLLVPYDARLFGGTVQAYMEMVQVRVAASTFVASADLAWLCYKTLIAVATTPEDADRRLIGPISAQQPPFLLGHDERDRIIHVFNIVIPVTELDTEPETEPDSDPDPDPDTNPDLDPDTEPDLGLDP